MNNQHTTTGAGNPTATTAFPKPGTVLTYKDAIPAYDALEDVLKSRVYTPDFSPNATTNDLAWHIDNLAAKHGIADTRPFLDLNDLAHRFTMERTALANGKDGARFHLKNDPDALAKHDETHLFEVGIDSEKLLGQFDKCIGLLAKKSENTDDYADAHSRNHPDREPDQDRHDGVDKVFRIVLGTLVALWACFGVCMLAHTFLGVGACTRWLM